MINSMEGHPIPQDITGFQFKLIGDMTIKQFAYVAFGAVIAWIAFSFPLPGIIKLPIAAFFALFGVGLAFLPVGGRPMDTMVLNFAKALFSPSRYIYQKSASNVFAPAQQFTQIKTPTAPVMEPQPKESDAGINQNVFFSQPQISHTQVATPKAEQIKEHEKPEVEKKPDEEQKEYLEKETESVQKELQQAKAEEETEKNTPSYETAHQKVLELEKLLSETVSQRQELERQILELQNKLTTQNQNTFKPTVAAPILKETKNVRSVPSYMGKSIGIPAAPEFPNLLIGIIKDARGNPLPSILVEVKDKEGNPARAFKTNGLGQFASATPLTNGTYRIEFEDPRGQVKFDAVEISAKGEVILPIEIIGTDQREELRKSLFNNAS